MDSMLGKGVGMVALVVLIALGSWYGTNKPLAVSPAAQTAQASCTSGSTSATIDQANTQCPKEDALTFYDPKLACGAPKPGCSSSTAIASSSASLSQVAGVLAATCPSNRANCSCKGGNSVLIVLGHCVAASVCKADASIDSFGTACTFDVSCKPNCGEPSAQGKTYFQELAKQLAVNDTLVQPVGYQPPTDTTVQPPVTPGSDPLIGGSVNDAFSPDSTYTTPPSPPIANPPAPSDSTTPPPPPIANPPAPPDPTTQTYSNGTWLQVPQTPPGPLPNYLYQDPLNPSNQTTFDPGMSPPHPLRNPQSPGMQPQTSPLSFLFFVTSFLTSFLANLDPVTTISNTTNYVTSLVFPSTPVPIGNSSVNPSTSTPSDNVHVVSIQNTPGIPDSSNDEQQRLRDLLRYANSRNEPSLGTPASNGLAGTIASPSSPSSPAISIGGKYTYDSAYIAQSAKQSDVSANAAPSDIMARWESLTEADISSMRPMSAFEKAVAERNGAWTGATLAHLQARFALAQEQSDYEGVIAAISAWQQLEDVGLCDETCRNTIATLQAQIPKRQKRIDALSRIVEAGPATLATASARDAQANPFGKSIIPLDSLSSSRASSVENNPFASGNSAPSVDTSGSSVADQVLAGIIEAGESVPTSTTTASLEGGRSSPVSASGTQAHASGQPSVLVGFFNIIVKAIQTFFAWLQPPVQAQDAAAPSCSLLKSLFGGCAGW